MIKNVSIILCLLVVGCSVQVDSPENDPMLEDSVLEKPDLPPPDDDWYACETVKDIVVNGELVRVIVPCEKEFGLPHDDSMADPAADFLPNMNPAENIVHSGK